MSRFSALFASLLAALITSLALTLSGCAIVYKLPTRQGNVIDQNQLNQLKLGMTRDQVHYLLGTPIASSSFEPDRWDYFGYYKPPRGEAYTRNVTLYFDGDKLSKMQGVELAQNATQLGTPDYQTLKKEATKTAKEKTADEENEEADKKQPQRGP